MSEQTSPMHDQSAAMDTPAPGDDFVAAGGQITSPAWRPAVRADTSAWDGTRVLAVLALALILLTGAFLRFSNGDWDHAIGHRLNEERPYDERYLGHLHPDERFLTGITTDIDNVGPWWNPTTLWKFLDTDESSMNPYNIQRGDGTTQTTFVYGTLPVFLNKFVGANADVPYQVLDAVKLGDPVNSTLSTLSGGRIGLPEQEFTGYHTQTLAGRWVSALIDVLTIVFVFLLGRRLGGMRTGLFAAGLYMFAPFALQNSHFYIVDPYVAFFAAICLFFSVRSVQDGGVHNFALAGIAAGLAAACKTTAVALAPVVILAIGIRSWSGFMPYLAPLWGGDTPEYQERRDGHKLDTSVITLVGGSLVAIVAGFIAYRLTMPYAFNAPSISNWLSFQQGHIGPIPFIYPDIMNQHWIADIQNQEKLLSGEAFPPNWQWVGRSKWLWPVQQMVMWGMGPAFGITAWLGVAFAAIYAWTKKEAVWLVPLAWVLGYLLFMGAQFSLYMRYFLPLYPALAVFAGFLLHQTLNWATSPEPFASWGRVGERLSPLKAALPTVARAGVIVVFVFTAIAGLAFFNIYRSPVTRAEASCWVYQNVPDGSLIGHEHWDDVVPYGQPDPTCGGKTFPEVTFTNYETDSPQKLETLLNNIDQVDYFIPSSARLSGVIPRVPAVWPVTTQFYTLLENDPEALGFRKAAEFTSYPRLFGRDFDDRGAEESFSVYDHPRVVVYEKTDEYSREKVRAALGVDAAPPACNVLPKDAAQNCVLFRADVLAAQQAGGTWTSIFNPDSVTNRFPAISFLLVMQIAAFAVLPLAVMVFRGLPDRGYLLTKPLGIMGLSYLVYAITSAGLADYENWTIAGVLLVMALVGGGLGWRWRAEIGAFFRERWRFALGCEALFLAMFLFSYWIRLQNPDLYHPFSGGEKPMDFAYFNGVLRTTDLTQGAIDPWFAGGYLNYYWWGFFVGATPTKLLGIVPEVAYNLVVPMFFALAAAATFSVAYNLAEGTRRMMRRRPGLLPIGAAGPIVTALLAVFLVMIAGNLRGIEELYYSLSVINNGVNVTIPIIDRDVPFLHQFSVIVGGLFEIIVGDHTFKDLARNNTAMDYDWWEPSRALDIRPDEPNQVPPITEFPFWTFLFADLHAHLMAIPFAMTAAGVGLGAVMNFSRLNPLRYQPGERRTMEIASWAMVIALGVIIGALRWINSWDYPPFLLIGAAALILGERAKEGRLTLRVLGVGAFKSAVMGVLSYVLFLSVAQNYSQSYSSVNPADQTTDFTDYLTHFGVFAFIMGGFLIFQLNRAITRSGLIRRIFFGSTRRTHPIETAPVMIALLAAAGIVIYLFATQRLGVLGLAIVALVVIALLAIREFRSHAATAPVMLFIYAMMALGFGLSGGVERFTLEGDVGRMNTVFKFYLHVWMMWGIVSAYALWYIFAVMQPQRAFLRRLGDASAVTVQAPRLAFGAIAIVLLLITVVYPVFGTRARVSERFDPSLGTGNDGLAWMQSENIREGGEGNKYITEYESTGIRGEHELRYTRDAIDWMRQNVDGTPTLIEAISIRYRSMYARFAINTGFPAVLGWDFHQSQQRVKFTQGLEQRRSDVNEFYTTGDAIRARTILEKYGVSWVIVGDEEHFQYGEDGMEKFEDGLGGALELAYENPSISIYRVLSPDEIEDQSAITR